MKTNKILVFMCVFIFGCNHNGKTNHVKDTAVSVKPVPEELIRLDKIVFPLLKSDSINSAIGLVDSLILKNKNDGTLLYERAFLYEYDSDFEKAISYYVKAENLGFNKKFCVDKISYCKKLLNDRNQVERAYHH